jgi:hypothetical protein
VDEATEAMGLNASLLSFREANLPLIKSGSRIDQIGSTHKRETGWQRAGIQFVARPTVITSVRTLSIVVTEM